MLDLQEVEIFAFGARTQVTIPTKPFWKRIQWSLPGSTATDIAGSKRAESRAKTKIGESNKQFCSSQFL